MIFIKRLDSACSLPHITSTLLKSNFTANLEMFDPQFSLTLLKSNSTANLENYDLYQASRLRLQSSTIYFNFVEE